jgi:hypothetical protein
MSGDERLINIVKKRPAAGTLRIEHGQFQLKVPARTQEDEI